MTLDTRILINFLQTAFNTLSLGFAKLIDKLASLNDRWADQLITLNIFKYVDINSTYRNRNIYPLSSNFVIPYTNAANGNTSSNSLDPVSLSFPFETNQTQAGSTINTVVLSSSSSSIDNFYVDCILDILGQYVRITTYNGVTHTAIVTPALSVAPVVNTPYSLRKGIPSFTGTLAGGSTQNILIFPATASSINGYYTNKFIRFTSGPNMGITKIITSYNGITKQVVLSTSIPFIPGLDTFEIDDFSYDNQTSLIYSGSRTLNQPVCYAIQLLQLSIPNLTLITGYGGTILNYPYVYVHFYNEYNSGITMYGNNNHAGQATFRVGIDRTVSVGQNFLVLANVNLTAPIAIKFSPTESIRFRITLPSGEDLAFATPDNPSPMIPNPFVQITALFGIKKIELRPKTRSVL